MFLIYGLLSFWIGSRDKFSRRKPDHGGLIRVVKHGGLHWGFVLVVIVSRKNIAGNHRHMIGVGTSVVAVVEEVDVEYAPDKPTNPRRPILRVGFHGMMVKPGNPGELWGEHPMCAFREFSPAQVVR